MARVSAIVVVPGRIAEAEALFYDPERRASWVDGFGYVEKIAGDWPRETGARLTWSSRAGGRGRVVEKVTAFEERVSQTCEIEEQRLRGTQTVSFEAEETDTRVTLSLDFSLEQRTWLGPLATFFVRRALQYSLERTLRRFAIEREAELNVTLG
jgi:hypothetical protein